MTDQSLLDRAKRPFLRSEGMPIPSARSYVDRTGDLRIAVPVNVRGVLATDEETATQRIRRIADAAIETQTINDMRLAGSDRRASELRNRLISYWTVSTTRQPAPPFPVQKPMARFLASARVDVPKA